MDNDVSSDLASELLNAKLVRINKISWEPEPWLAESWTISDDKLRYTLKLRDAVWSDGQPFTSDDVVFTFAALEKAQLGDSIVIGGKRVTAAASDPRTVVVTFPAPFAPGVRILDNFPIVPKHRLEPALKKGEFEKAWGPATPPGELAGLGPFVLKEYASGQRLVFERNPRYWRKAADGTVLPYLDRLTIEIIPDQNAELLRLENGQLDVVGGEVPPDQYATIRRAAAAGKVALTDLGVKWQADGWWVNLRPSKAKDPRAKWLQSEALRHAVSMAVDRQVFADTVYYGAGEPAYGTFTPTVKKWYWTGTPQMPYDPEGAKKLLASAGVPADARFSLVTQKGRPRMERAGSVIVDQLKKVGLTVDLVTLDGLSVVKSIMSGDYDTTYFAPNFSDQDPAVSPDFWLSSGALHFWNPGQKMPATAWEKQIDDLMARQSAAFDEAERKRLFDDVQKIFIEHQPVVYFGAWRDFVAVSTRVVNAKPSHHWLPVLWNPDEIAVR